MSCNYQPTSYSNSDLTYLNKKFTHWSDKAPKINYAPKSETTLLFGGLTPTSERLLQAAAKSLGENYQPLPLIDNKSLQMGKMYGNRGQCNPTYYTVGNLIKYLIYLRDELKIPTDEIVKKYAFVTANGCGPCRFGMYVTEYKKALKDAGFEGFRIVAFEHNKSIFQESNQEITNFSPKFFLALIKAVLISDILTTLGFQMRPYEVVKGSVDSALKECEERIVYALEHKKSLLKALRSCKKVLENVKLNRLQIRPKVMVMGEFWAAMTQSDGNYHIHHFLENEGAEVIHQPLVNRLLLDLWELENLKLEKDKLKSQKLIDFNPLKSKLMLKLAKGGIVAQFNLYAKAIGLKGYKLPNMEHLAALAKDYYNLDNNAGEGHLEVAHLLEAIKDRLAHLVISIKPFGCMPSSGVSDGVQSLIVAKYPNANFLSVETSGEGSANFYSRVQMALFKAKEEAKEEFLQFNMPKEIPSKVNRYNYYPKSKFISTAAKILDSLNRS